MAGRVRVVIYAADPGPEPGAVQTAYHEVSAGLAGTDGLLGNELLRSAAEPGRFAVLSEWVSLAAFRAWESGTDHRDATAALRPYHDARHGPAFAVYEVVAAY